MPFLDSLDIANRALQHCGAEQIASVTEDSKNNKETAFAYDKVRQAELERNLWRFSVRRAVLRAVDTDTMILVPAAYDATKTYLPGAIVADTNGQLWLSMEQNNFNNTPGDTDVWDVYFGPLTVAPYDSTTTYFAGELVYKPGTLPGSFVVYLSLTSGNADVPSTATVYDATKTYHGDAVVSYSGSQWLSLIEVNLGVTPADGPLAYDNTATYSAAQTVTGSDHFIYSSVAGSNVGHDPVTDGGVHWTNTGLPNAWARTPTLPVASTNWRVISATIKNLSFTYPVGAGPLSQSTTRNVFRLPSGYLRKAPQDPNGWTSSMTASRGSTANDWEYDGNYIVSSDAGPIVFRFGADVTKVADMHAMFCEGLAARIATAICQPITQSDGKLQTIASAYKLFMSEARMVNAIEEGPVESEEDFYITCRA